MFNKIAKVNSDAVPSQARASSGPATVGFEYDVAEAGGLVVTLSNDPLARATFVPTIAGVGAPTNGVTGAGVLPTNGFYFDNDNGVLWINAGTKSNPAYTQAATEVTDAAVRDGLGNSGIGGDLATFAKTTAGTPGFMGSISGVSRRMVGVVTVTEAFADNGDSQPVFKLGVSGDTERYLPSAALTDAPVGTRIPIAGLVGSTEAPINTATAAVGAGTGAIRIDWLTGLDLD